MLRIFKNYQLNLSKSALTISFSSSPGFLSSVDDYYTTSAGLTIIETTNGFFNNSLFKEIVPQSVLSWMRIMIATNLASSGQEWTDTFSQYNSGTYCNQFMIVSWNEFKSQQNQPVSEWNNILWIHESLPLITKAADVTDILVQQSYWASYNIPYFRSIYYSAGFESMKQQYGNGYSYNQCPRANIFRRDHSNVINLESMQTIMTYNQYQTDPLSLGDPCNAIMCRQDLPLVNNNSTSGEVAFGGIDSKITNSKLAAKLITNTMNGPTHTNQSPFQWIKQFESVSHLGQPEIFKFPFINIQPINSNINSQQPIIEIN